MDLFENLKRHEWIVAVAIIIGIIGSIFITGIFVWQEINTLDEPQSIITQDIVDDLKNLIPSNSGKPLDWIREDGRFIVLRGSKLYNNRFNSIDDARLAAKEFKEFFIGQKFTINEENYLPEGTNGFIHPRVGFEQNDLKCLISWEEGWSFDVITEYPFSLICAHYTQEAEENFAEFYSIVAARPLSRVMVARKNENFAVGSSWSSRSGVTWYASKHNGEWILDETTQEFPCYKGIIDTYPKEFFSEQELEYCEKYPY